MSKRFYLTLASMIAVVMLPLFAIASKQKAFYSSQACILGISGDAEALLSADSVGRFVSNPVKIDCTVPVPADGKKFTPAQIAEVENSLNTEQVGRKVLQYLYESDGKSVSDRLLMERAASNRQLCGLPALSEAQAHASFQPLLMHNYIYLERQVPVMRKTAAVADAPTVYYRAYMLFKVVSTPDTWSHFSEMPTAEMLDTINVRVEYLRGGAIGHHTQILTELERHVPDFKYAGAITSTTPLTASFGTNSGLDCGSLVEVYRQISDENGVPASERLGYARVGTTTDGSCILFPQSYSLRDSEPGDVAVKTGGKRSAFQLEATWMKHLIGGAFSYSYLCSQNTRGYGWRLMLELGYSASDIGNNKIVKAEYGKRRSKRLRGPVNELYGQIGVGFFKTFGGLVEVMPQVMLGYGIVKTHTAGPDTGKSVMDIFKGHYIRIPVGVTAGFNCFYPMQMLFTLGYIPRIGFEYKNAQGYNENHEAVSSACDLLGVGIDGFYMKLGLRYNF